MSTQVVRPRQPTIRQRIRLGLLFLMLILFPITMNYLSVFLIIEGSSTATVTFSLLFWSAWVVAALFFGRAACGYLCPLGAFQETKDRMVPARLKKMRYLKMVKYVLAVAWVGAIVVSAVLAGGYDSIDLLYNTSSGVSIDRAEGWIMWGLIVLVVLLPSFLIGKRAFCRYLCPWGVLNTVSTRIKNFLRLPSLRLEPEGKKCKRCGTCSVNCPMSLPVAEMVQRQSMNNDECILCGTCVDNCPNRAIHYTWRRSQ